MFNKKSFKVLLRNNLFLKVTFTHQNKKYNYFFKPSHLKKRLYREYAKKGIKIFLQKYGMISFDNLYCFLRHKLTFFFLFSFCFLLKIYI